MSDKYVDVSATYNGDGTSSSQAASDGASGAWNDLLAVMIAAPTYGTLNSGDNVWIRTKASGSNLSATATASITMLARGSITQPVIWIFDNLGQKWSGDTGVFTLNINNTYSFLGVNFNNIYATVADGVVFNHKQSSLAHVAFATFYHQELKKCKFITETPSTSFYTYIINSGLNNTTVFEECSFYLHRCDSSQSVFSAGQTRGSIYYKNCLFDISQANSVARLFRQHDDGTAIFIIGGKAIGLQTQYLNNTRLGCAPFECDGFDPGLLILSNPSMSAADTRDGRSPVRLSNIPGTDSKYDFHEERISGYSRWKAAGNYPTLAATLPDTARTPWSIQCLPRYACPGMPHTITDMVKFYNGSADQLTLTLEFLLNPVYSSPSSNGWWIEVVYTDSSTGLTKFLSTYEIIGQALSESTVTWSSLVYGAKTYGRYKISITTPTDVKADSDVRVIFRTSVAATNITTDPDFYFVCPDFSMVAA